MKVALIEVGKVVYTKHFIR